MSLNGLDDPKVKEAHEAAVAEPGGWFLLKYASRDEIELLGRGNGGIVEIRNNIAQHEESSPLFGFLRYRRRNVLIKYLREDCSRLVQARTTVHFNTLCDHFAPYDTTFSIATAKELKDTKLSAACSLHTASGSTSSSTSSLRRRRLMEIAEEEEEEERERKRQSLVTGEVQRPRTAATVVEEGSTGAPSALPPVTLNSDLASSVEASNFAGRVDPPDFVGSTRPTSPAKSFDEAGRRMSSQSSRLDLYGYSSYPYKPKVKLGPRPSLDRPRTSAGTGTYRPTASIPAGLKALSKGPRRSQSPHKSDDNAGSPIKEEPETGFLAATSISIPENAALNPPPRPHTSSGASAASAASATQGGTSSAASIQSVALSIPPLGNKHGTMSVEKARLMKAMKLREKKKKMAEQPLAGVLGVETHDETVAPGLAPEREDIVGIPERALEADEVDPVKSQSDHLHDRLSISKADSGVEIEIGADHVSVDTRSDSHPTSPIAASSDIGDSTKASSLSELTDETVQAGSEEKIARSDVEAAEETLVVEQPTREVSGEAVPEAEAGHGAAELDESEEAEEAGTGERIAEYSRNDLSETAKDVEGETEHSREGEAVPSWTHGIPVSKFSATSPVTSVTSARAEESEDPVKESSADRPATPDLDETPHDGVEPPKSQASQFKIPLSRFSTQDSGKPLPDPPTVPIPSIIAPDTDTEQSDNGIEEGRSSQGEAKRRLNTAEATESGFAQASRPRRNPALDSIRTEADHREADKRQSVVSLFDDDDFMDELQSATFQEAKPMVVSKSPIASVFPQNAPALRRANTEGLESGTSPSRIVRTVSNPIRGPLLMPGDVSTSSARAVSSGAVFLHKITQQSSSDLRPKTAKLGSSISQRIKALEKLSTSSIAGEGTPKERPSSAFFAVRKSSVREPSRSSSVADRTNSLTRGVTPSPPQSRESSPELKVPVRDRSGSMATRLSVFEGGNLPRGRPESVQVTARIVRDSSQPFPKAHEARTNPADLDPLDLRHSRLVIDLQAADETPGPSADVRGRAPAQEEENPAKVERKPSLLQRRLSRGRRQPQTEDVDENAPEEMKDDTDTETSRQRRRSSLTIVKDFIKDRRDSLRGIMSPSVDNLSLTASAINAKSPGLPTPSRSPARPPSVHQNISFPRRLSISSRRSSLDQKSPGPPATSHSAGALSPPLMPESGGESEGEGRQSSRGTSPNPGKSGGNRASRFIRRLSSSLSSSRKNMAPSISPTVAEEDAAEVAAAGLGVSQTQVQAQPAVLAYMGDVNVQFPDNLLWKRRTMCLDSHGFLILSAVQGVTATMPATAIAMAGKDRHHQAGAVKRYHMSDFRMPYIPDVEIQELPNSVVLDFVDGSGLQIACEDRAGQLNILHILEDAHQNHSNFGL